MQTPDDTPDDTLTALTKLVTNAEQQYLAGKISYSEWCAFTTSRATVQLMQNRRRAKTDTQTDTP